jgi:hypothetical protein
MRCDLLNTKQHAGPAQRPTRRTFEVQAPTKKFVRPRRASLLNHAYLPD